MTMWSFSRLRRLSGMTASLLKGEVVSLDHVGSFADGTAVKRVGDYTFDICRVSSRRRSGRRRSYARLVSLFDLRGRSLSGSF